MQRFFCAVYTESESNALKNRVIGLFSNQTKMLDAFKQIKDFDKFYLRGKRKNVPLTNTNIAIEFKRDNHLIIFRDEIPAIKVQPMYMNEVNEKLISAIND